MQYAIPAVSESASLFMSKIIQKPPLRQTRWGEGRSEGKDLNTCLDHLSLDVHLTKSTGIFFLFFFLKEGKHYFDPECFWIFTAA